MLRQSILVIFLSSVFYDSTEQNGNSHSVSCSFGRCRGKLFFERRSFLMIDQVSIGKFISSLRKEKKLTQEQLAERLGVNNRSVSRWENKKLDHRFMAGMVC